VKRHRIQRSVSVVAVAAALGVSGTLFVAATSGGSASEQAPPDARTKAETPRDAVSDCKPAPARCGSEESDLLIAAANEAGRRMLELETTGSTTAANPAP
jgi:hypothetical protein